MREPNDLRHEEYQLTKVHLAREDVPAEALALLSTWIEGEGLLVDEREEVGGIAFCRMDSRVMAPLPHIFASFFARRPYKRKAGHNLRWNDFYLLLHRDVEQGWKLLQMRGDTSHAAFIPVLAAHARAVKEIEKRLGEEMIDSHITCSCCGEKQVTPLAHCTGTVDRQYPAPSPMYRYPYVVRKS